jgi:hypothetical protein
MIFRRIFLHIRNLYQKLHILTKFQKNRIRMHKTRVYRWEHLSKYDFRVKIVILKIYS